MAILSIAQNEYYIQELKSGNRNVFTQIFHLYSKSIYANIKRLVPDDKDAEDILQDVFISLWNKKDSLDYKIKIDGWLFKTSYYKSLEYLKNKISSTLISDYNVDLDNALVASDLDVEGEKIYKDKLNLLQNAINNLSEKRKDAFVLCKVQGRSYAEAAELMGVSTTTIKDYVKVATKLVKKYTLLNEVTLSILLAELLVFK